VFTHYEAWTLHRVRGATNPTKWDIIQSIPHRPDLGPDDVGTWLREQIARRLDRLRALRRDPAEVEWDACDAA